MTLDLGVMNFKPQVGCRDDLNELRKKNLKFMFVCSPGQEVTFHLDAHWSLCPLLPPEFISLLGSQRSCSCALSPVSENPGVATWLRPPTQSCALPPVRPLSDPLGVCSAAQQGGKGATTAALATPSSRNPASSLRVCLHRACYLLTCRLSFRSSQPTAMPSVSSLPPEWSPKRSGIQMDFFLKILK